MKTIIKNTFRSVFMSVIGIGMSTMSQAQCPNNNANYGTISSIAPGATATVYCMYGGERATVAVVAGSTYTFSTCGGSWDSQLSIYSTSGAFLAYNDDACGLQSSVTWTATFSGNVYVNLDRYYCTNQNSCMDLNVTRAGAPATNPCSSISSLNCGVSGSFNVTGSGAWNNLGGPYSTPGSEKVFSFTPSYSGSFTINVSSNFSWVDLYYKTGSCGSTGWTYIDDIYSTSSNAVNLTGGTTYYFLIDDENTSSSSGSITINCPPPAANPCTSITSITCGSPANFSLTGSGAWNNLGGPYSTPGQENVFAYTPTSSGSYDITVTSNSSWVDLYYKTGSCGSTGWTYVDDIYSSGTNSVTLSAGTTYYFLIDDENTSSSSGTINISCPCLGTSVDGVYAGEFNINSSTVNACDDNSLRASFDRTYAWTVDCAGNYTVSLCGSSFDTYLYLTSNVGSGIIASNDDSYCGNSYSLQSEVSVFLNPGTYYITVEAFSSSTVGDFTLNVSGTTSPSVSASMTPATCNGFADGSITASATGGCNIMYSLDGGAYQATGSWSGVAAGGHTITAMNSFGNTSSTYIMVTEPAPIVVDLTTTNPFNATACVGGSVNLTANVSGGAGALNYVWSFENNAGGQTSIPSWSGSDVSPFTDVNSASPSATRPYRITVISANNPACSAYDELLVTIIPDPVISIIESTNVSCFGANDGTATASVITGGLPLNYGYNWFSDDNNSSNNNPAGDGTNAVTGLFPSSWVVNTTVSGPSYGCSASANVTITQPEELIASASNTEILCNGGTSTVVVNAVGGTLPYSGTGIDIVGAGDYNYTVSDANGCTSMVSVSISEPDPITLYAGDDAVLYYGYDPMACYATTASVDGGTPGYEYNWSNGSTEASLSDCPSESVTYTLTVTDANGCSVSDDIWVCVVDVVCQAGNSNNFKVEMCQIPPGNPNNAHTICVDASAVPAHLAIGCTLGACGEQAEICGAPLARTPEKELAAALTVYPNPTSDLATVSVTLTQGGTYDISLMDMMGKEIRKIYVGSFEQYENLTFDLDLGVLNSGMYMVTIQHGGSVIENVKVVKQ